MRISLQRGNIVYLLLSGLVYFFAVYIAPLILPKTLSVGSRISMTVIIALLATFIMITYATKVKNDIDREDRKHSFLIIFAIGLIGFIAMMILQGVINTFLQYLSQFYHFQTNSENTANVVKIVNSYPIFILYVVVLGPVMEELFFRKAVFGYFYDVLIGSKEWIRFFIPALLTGILFAIPHDGFSPIMLIYIAMSFVFSYLYKFTNRIITPMIAHISMNGLVMVIQIMMNGSGM